PRPPGGGRRARPPPARARPGGVRAESETRLRSAEPMVPVAAVGQAATPPVAIAPAVAGTWRWIDTRVLSFTAAPRLPQASEIVVTVAAGARAASGAVLAKPAVGRFTTPPVQVTGVFPRGGVLTDSAIAIQLDQDVDPVR